MIAAGGVLAWSVYRYLGLKFVSRSWFNLDDILGPQPRPGRHTLARVQPFGPALASISVACSRQERSDFGVNAGRIRAYMAKLKQQLWNATAHRGVASRTSWSGSH
jgi:hypothetical protein